MDPAQQQQQQQPQQPRPSPAAPAPCASAPSAALGPLSTPPPPPPTSAGDPLALAVVGATDIGRRAVHLLSGLPGVRSVSLVDAAAAGAALSALDTSPSPKPHASPVIAPTARSGPLPPPAPLLPESLRQYPAVLGSIADLAAVPDAVWVCARIDERPAHVRAAALLGVRCIYCVAPIAPSASETSQLFEVTIPARDVASEMTGPLPPPAPLLPESLRQYPAVLGSIADLAAVPDAVWVCARIDERPAHVRAAALLGVRCIYCVAPIAPSASETSQLFEFCRAHDSELLCGWVRRFDAEIGAVVGVSRGGGLVSAHVRHHDHPSRTAEELQASRVSIFLDFMADDFDTAASLMEERMPVSLQATVRDTYGTGYADTAVANLQYPGGKSVFIEATLVGGVRYECSVEAISAGGKQHEAGRHGWPHSYVQRFEGSLRAQAEYFVSIARGDPVERCCKQEHLIMAARLGEMAAESAENGCRVLANPSMRLLQIGNGRFGSHIQRVLQKLPNCETVGIITSANSELELDSMLARADVDAVYICTPYAHTLALAKRALGYKKKVLCEKPVPNLPDLQQIAVADDRMLMLAYYRRFDAEYRRAKAFVDELGSAPLTSLVVESRDVTQPCDDTIVALYESVIADFDTLAWLLEDVDCELSVKGVKVHGPASSLTVTVSVWLSKYDRTFDAQVLYSRGSPVYRQTVMVNGRSFGHESRDPCYFNTFNDAYLKMFQHFANHVPTPGQGHFCMTYSRGHELLAAAIEKASDERDFVALHKHPLHPQGVEPYQEEPLRSPPLEEFNFAVASHGGLFTTGPRLYKPTLYEGNEWKVYNLMKEHEPQLRGFLPEVYDQVIVNDVLYLVMKNLVHGYSKPRVLNVKIGEPGDFHKMCYMPFGVRIAGYTGDAGIKRAVSQSWNDMVGYFKDYIKDREINTSRYEEIPHWLKALRELLVAVERQKTFRFRAASLLFVYDSVDDAPQRPTVHLIDMTRTVVNPPPGRVDHLLCFGIKNLCRILEETHQKFVTRHAVFLCRHGYRQDYGDLSWVSNSKYPHDPPLSQEGLRQARDLARRLKYENIDAIVTSPFQRAVQTAKAIAEELNIKFVVEPALAEFMSISNRKTIPDLDPSWRESTPLLDPTYKQVEPRLMLESWDTMCARAHEALAKLSQQYRRIAVVSHRSTFQALLSVILGDKFKKQLQFASITSLLPSENDVGWKIDRLNSYSHLTRVMQSPEHNPNYKTAVYKDMIVGADGKILPSGFN
eukprot:m51a1_g7671 putative phosphoglycerate mutase (1251) ;mRNA; f:483406-488439